MQGELDAVRGETVDAGRSGWPVVELDAVAEALERGVGWGAFYVGDVDLLAVGGVSVGRGGLSERC